MSEQRTHSAGASSKVWALLILFFFLLALVAGGAQAQEDPADPPIPPVEILKQEPVPGGVNTVIQISVSKDAYISSAHPSSNYGALTTTKIGYEAGGDGAMRIVLQFDLSSIPPNVTINSAQFKYYLVESRPASDTPMGFLAQFMKASWSEYGVTWNNASYLGGTPLPIGEVPGTPGWYASDGTAAVQAWYSGTQPNYGVLITGDEGPERNRSRIFYSREKSGYSPVLVVDYTASCDIVPPVATVSALPTYSPGSFQVKWSGTDSAPSGCTPSGIAYYDVEYRVNGGAWVSWKTQTIDTSATIQSGANGSLYEFRARAVDKAGNVQGFSGAQASTRVDTVPPNAEVLDLDSHTFAAAFFVQWIGTDNLSGIATYDLQWRTSSGNWQPLIENTTQTSFQFTGGQNGVTYQFRARARDKVGNVQPFSDQAQAQTTVFLYPTATVLPFDPPILKPTAPITDTFMVNWAVNTGPTTVTETRIYYQYKLGQWKLWDVFPYPQLSAPFPWEQLGLGDGPYAFEAIALNTLGQVEPLSGQPEAIILVDMADLINPRAYLPIHTR
jgi:hypothetical protein